MLFLSPLIDTAGEQSPLVNSVLIMFVTLIPVDLAEFIITALVPEAEMTSELETLCSFLDGELPGESGDTDAHNNQLNIASCRLEELCKPYMAARGARVRLPAGAVVTRIVTVSYSF